MPDEILPPAPESGGAPRLPLLIVGASTRAAAFSALRAGFEPICCDQFADADLQAAARVVKCDHFPDGFLDFAARRPGTPLLYAGGLENHPQIVEQLGEGRILLGNSPQTLRGIRDPLAVAAALKQSKLPHLEVRDGGDPPPPDGSWLLKPLRSAGGRGIVPWTAEAAAGHNVEHSYFQQRAEGKSYSALFVAREGVGDVRFVGVTEQLIGEAFCNGAPFSWCGNIGPTALPIHVESAVRRLANLLKWKFQLRGLFGIDFLVDGDVVGMTEVNPRYPASVELLEFATGGRLLRDHAACFGVDTASAPDPEWAPQLDMVFGKAVLYSPSRAAVQFNREFGPDVYRSWTRFFDVPETGSIIQPGEPICTVAACAATAAECRRALEREASGILGERR